MVIARRGCATARGVLRAGWMGIVRARRCAAGSDVWGAGAMRIVGSSSASMKCVCPAAMMGIVRRRDGDGVRPSWGGACSVWVMGIVRAGAVIGRGRGVWGASTMGTVRGRVSMGSVSSASPMRIAAGGGVWWLSGGASIASSGPIVRRARVVRPIPARAAWPTRIARRGRSVIGRGIAVWGVSATPIAHRGCAISRPICVAPAWAMVTARVDNFVTVRGIDASNAR